MAAAQPNHRASLLAGLRTGGVRSVSTPMPHTAAPAGSFHVPQMLASPPSQPTYFPEEEEMDQLADMVSNNAPMINNAFRQTRTAGPDARMSQQQQELLLQRQYLAQLSAMNSAPAPQGLDYQNQANLQMQMMQMEIMRLHAIAQMQQQMAMAPSADQRYQRRTSGVFDTPATAGPRAQSFSMNGPSPLEQLRSRQTDNADYGGVPMTASLGGRFGSRVGGEQLPGYSRTTASVGGATMAPSKSDSAISWRRGSTPTTGVAKSSPGLATPPSSDSEKESSPPAPPKTRPQPLRFTNTPVRVPVAVSSNDDSEGGYDSSSSKSDTEQTSSSPTTPMSSNSHTSTSYAREEAKKALQSLGIGKPSIHVTAPSEGQVVIPSVTSRIILQPIRQPRGPPGAADELGDKNFANRIRKKAIGGLGVLMEARGKRDAEAESI